MNDRPRHFEEFEPYREVVPGAPADIDAFLDWISGQPEGVRFELSRGRVYKSMVWVSRAHASICANIMFELMNRLDRDMFQISAAEFGVRTPHGARFPDVMVDPAGGPPLEKAAKRPSLLVEVLSPSTEDVDFGEKLEEYQTIDSLQHYMICSQTGRKVWLWTRNSGDWPADPEIISDQSGIIALSALAIDLPMVAIYRGIRF